MAYRPYRGAKVTRKKHRALAAVLAVILLIFLLVAGFFILQEYIVFTADGFRFEFPFSQGKADDPPPVIPPKPDDKTPDDGKKSDGTDAPDNPGTSDPGGEKPPETPAPAHTQAFLLTPDRLLDESVRSALLSSLDELGMNAVALDVLARDGILHISSSSDFAVKSEAVAENAQEVGDAISLLKEDGRRLAAVLAICCNNITPRAYRSGAVQTSGVLWLDYQYHPWFNPYKQTVADYLQDLIETCAEAGFDEVILSDLAFPTHGKTFMIDIPENETAADRIGAIEGLAKAARTAADEYGLTLSLLLDANPPDQASGQDVGVLSSYFDKIYLSAADENDVKLKSLTEQLSQEEVQVGAILPSGKQPTDEQLDYVMPYPGE